MAILNFQKPDKIVFNKTTEFEGQFAQHDECFLISIRRHVIEARVGMRDPHVFRLRAVDGVPEDPAAVAAVRVHAFPAVLALSAGRHA